MADLLDESDDDWLIMNGPPQRQPRAPQPPYMAAHAYDGDIDDEVRAIIPQDRRMRQRLGNRFPEVAACERAYNDAPPVLRQAIIGARRERFEAGPMHNLANPNALGRSCSRCTRYIIWLGSGDWI